MDFKFTSDLMEIEKKTTKREVSLDSDILIRLMSWVQSVIEECR